MAKPQKVTKENWWEYKQYMDSHTVKEGMRRFNLSWPTASAIKNAASYETMRKTQKARRKHYYLSASDRANLLSGVGPFGGAKTPTRSIPLQEYRQPETNGEVITRKIVPIAQTGDSIGSKEIHKWGLNEQLKQLEERNQELAIANERRGELIAYQNKLIIKLRRELERATGHIVPETTFNAYNGGGCNAPAETTPKETKTEITVGDVHIVITGGNDGATCDTTLPRERQGECRD